MISPVSDLRESNTIASSKGLPIFGKPLLLCLVFNVVPSPLSAQNPQLSDNTIVVIGPRPIDSTVERALNDVDVTAYGADTIGELITEISSETGDSDDEVVFLVNGKRVSGLGEIEELPAEVVSKIEVLAPGSGRNIGANSTQRVYNILLHRSADIGAGRLRWIAATEGGWESKVGGVSYTHIRGARRINAAMRLRADDALLESERNISQPDPTSDEAAFRSLSPNVRRWDLSVSVSDQLTDWLQGSLGGKASTTKSIALLGRDNTHSHAGALQQSRNNAAFTINASINADAGKWLIATFGEYRLEKREADTDRIRENQHLLSNTRSTGETISGLILATGPLFELPSGALRLSLGAGVDHEMIEGIRSLGGIATDHRSALTTKTVSAGLEVPLASAKRGVLPFFGELVAGIDFSRLTVSPYDHFDNWTYSMNWSPVEKLRFNVAVTRGSSPPSLLSLDEPIIETPGIRYFDPVLAETAIITRLTGGVLGLPPSGSHTTKIGASFKPVRGLGLQFTSEFFASSSMNVVTELPAASAAIIAAFPERFLRDASGRLVQVDARPVVLASRRQKQLRSGFTLNLPFGMRSEIKDEPASSDEDSNDDNRPEGVPPRLQMALTHTWLLESGVVIRPGEPSINLLSPAAIALGGLGQPRHRITFSLGYAERGLGIRLSGQHRSVSTLEASGRTENVLRFSPLTTLNVRAWIDGQRLIPQARFMKGARLTVELQNIAGVRERVRDEFRTTPLAYQPAYRDPIGRTFMIELRKTF